MGRRMQAAKAYLGFGASSPASSTAGSGSTQNSSVGGWFTYDEKTAREHHKLAQVSNLPDRSGALISDPYTGGGDHILRNFGRPTTWRNEDLNGGSQ